MDQLDARTPAKTSIRPSEITVSLIRMSCLDTPSKVQVAAGLRVLVPRAMIISVGLKRYSYLSKSIDLLFESNVL